MKWNFKLFSFIANNIELISEKLIVYTKSSIEIKEGDANLYSRIRKIFQNEIKLNKKIKNIDEFIAKREIQNCFRLTRRASS